MILDTIIDHKKKELSERNALCPLAKLQDTIAGMRGPRDFAAALRGTAGISIIAEVKKASPSKGVIREDFDPVTIARAYERNGAAAISVLTDERFFQGHLDYLTAVKSAVNIPVFRKDFIIDPYQIYEARAAGADALLLIAAVLDAADLAALHHLAYSLGMHTLIEVHTAEELTSALKVCPEVVGINNRNLNTFKTSIDTSIELSRLLPENVVRVSESGINTSEDIAILKQAGINAFLIGESLMREDDPGRKLNELLHAHS